MNVEPAVIEAAYAELKARKRWTNPISVHLTKQGRIIVGGRATPIPATAALVCNYTQPLPDLAEFRGDIEHEAGLMQAAEIAAPERVVELVRKSSRGLTTTAISRQIGLRTTEAAEICEELWRAVRIGRKRVKRDRGPWSTVWVRDTSRPSLRPVVLPTGPTGEPRCAGRKTYPGAPACPMREECARYRALLDTWNALPDDERQSTACHSYMCPGKGFPHFLEIPNDD